MKIRNSERDMLLSPEDQDLETLSVRSDGRYAKVKDSYVHRIIAERFLNRPLAKGEIVDHISGDRLDNRRENLRVADKSTNARNCKLTKRNRSGYKGVSLASDGKRWEARIMSDYKIVWREQFDSPVEASEAYRSKRAEMFGKDWQDQ